MIKILDSSFKRLAIVKNVESSQITKEINGEYTFSFDCVLDEKTSLYVVEGNIVEIEDDYFDIVYYQKQQNDDGTLTIQVQCEHISYRLNNSTYDLETFASTGTVTQVLTAILSGTGFSLGTCELNNSVTYSAQEKKSRRQLLMEFIAYIGAEIDFNKLTVSIKNHIGSTNRKLLAKGKNVKVVSKIYNAREKNGSGQPLVSYTVAPIQLTNMSLDLGDEVLLIQKELGIQEQLRIVKINYNPYNNIEASVELANFIFGLEDHFYRIETQQVTKDKIYNGCKIGPDEGFVAERSDGKAKTVMNATDGISIYSDIGSGLVKNFYVDMDGKIKAKQIDIDGSGTFRGTLDVDTDVLVGQHIKMQVSDNVRATLKAMATTGGYSLFIASNIDGTNITDLDRIDMFLNWLYVYGNLYVQSKLDVNGIVDFRDATQILGMKTTSAGSHGHTGYTGTDGAHNHGIPAGAKLAIVDDSFNVVGYYQWQESGAHYHGVSVSESGGHEHAVTND